MLGENYDKNLKDFMEKYGVEGFLKIYFKNFLFKALRFQMRSSLGDSSDLKKDPGIAFYIKDNKICKISDVDKFEKDLQEICFNLAEKIIKKLKQSKKFEDLFSGNIEKINDNELEKIFLKELHKTFMELKYKDE
jgi:hypothetical protein